MTLELAIEKLTDQERALLDSYEADIQVSKWVMIDRVIKIHDGKLWREEYATFEDYLWYGLAEINFGDGWKLATYRQYKASYEAYTLARTNGVELSNEYAARSLRMVEEALRPLVINRAVKYHEIKTGHKPTVLTAAMLAPAAEEVKAVIDTAANTGGYVGNGNGGMNEFGAAIDRQLAEREQRHRQHMIDEAKKRGGWSNLIIDLDNELWLEDLPATGRIELKWRVVNEEQR